jgi:hypothetical protein
MKRGWHMTIRILLVDDHSVVRQGLRLFLKYDPELEVEGLVSALTKQAAALQARYEIAVSTELCDEPDLPLRTKQELYRIAQEAMHNTVKLHARARWCYAWNRLPMVLRWKCGTMAWDLIQPPRFRATWACTRCASASPTWTGRSRSRVRRALGRVSACAS